MPNLPAIIDAIRHQPDNERHLLALAGWLWDNGRDDEVAVVRVFWPTAASVSFAPNAGNGSADAKCAACRR